MPEIHVPLVHGLQEGVDPKLMPDGWMSRAENVRFRKDGRLGSRYGYDFISGSQGAMVAGGNYGPKRAVYVKDRVSATAPPLAYDRHDDGTFVVSGTAGTSAGSAQAGVAALGVPRRASAARNLKYTALASDTAVASGRIFCVIDDTEYASSGNRGLVLVVLDATTHALLYSAFIGAFHNPKIIICGTFLVVAYANGNNIDYVTSSTTSTGGFLSTGTLVTATAGRAFAFDASAYDGSNFLLVYETSAINMRWSSVAISAGVIGVITVKHNVAIANPVRPSISIDGSASANVALVWAEGATFNTGNVHWLVDSFAGVPQSGKATIDASGLAVGFPVAGRGPSAVTATRTAFAWARSDQLMGTFTTVTGTVKNIGMLAPFCRPFPGPLTSAGTILMWCATFANTGQTASFATYKLIDLVSIQAGTQGAVCEASACQQAAMAGAYITTNATNQTLVENRRSCPSVTTLLTTPSSTAFVVSLPTQTTSGRWSVDLVRMDSSPYADRLLPAKINGQLIFSGARVQEFDGSSFYESGLGDGPEYTAAADAGVGAMGAGTYQYSFVHRWTDANGLIHRSPPSTPVSVTIGALRNVLVSCSTPAFSSRFSFGANDINPGVVSDVYRTLAGGSIFYYVTSIFNTQQWYTGAVFTGTDSALDATIAVNEVLYTQGERGGLSGLLPNDEPPPCKFIWAGNNRLIMGGLEQASEVRWSKLVFPGEPVQYADDPAFMSRIDGEVAGVTCLDGTWFVGSRDSIFAFRGDGPDDTGKGGDFGDPIRVPSDIGFYSQRSIVEIPQGVLFQGRSDRIYLLPRGGGAPQWVGQNVRDTLTLYPVITDAQLLPDENTVVFSCMNTAGSDGVLIVYDTRVGEWTVDIPFNGASTSSRVFHCVDSFNGKLVLDGQFAETSLYADDESGSQDRAIVGTFVTGDMRPFGALGHGRFRRFVLLSEYRSATTFTIEESVDGGVTYQTAATYTPTNSAGDTVNVEYDLPIVRGEAYRFRVISTPTSPGEGFVFNSLTGEVFPDKGTPRLANAYRA